MRDKKLYIVYENMGAEKSAPIIILYYDLDVKKVLCKKYLCNCFQKSDTKTLQKRFLSVDFCTI